MAASTAATGGSADKRGTGRPNHSPPVELPSSNAKDFFEEAKIGQVEEAELRRKFAKFCTKVPTAGGEEESFLTLDNFCSMLQYYECASAQHYESYFHAVDRNHDDRLDFPEFFLGCCAADPSTVHILNSFTGYERSQYIFDFYDSDRSATLDFNEFARLTADCLGTHPGEDQTIRAQAVEKARELGALEEGSTSPLQFVPIKFKQFYEFIQNERLRGTSRLFRFYKSIIKSRGSHHGRRAQGSSATSATPSSTVHGDDAPQDDPPSDQESLEWHAHLLDMDSYFGQEAMDWPPTSARPAPPPYSALLPPAPAPLGRSDTEPPPVADARALARKVLRTLNSPGYDGLVPTADVEAPFSLVSPAQLRSLCSAASRSLEMDDMVLSNIQPPVKIFGALHGQLFDLLSIFKWQQGPLEESGDILYTSYVFLGDYADRGAYSLEVLTLLLSLKVVHPNRVFLLRGHHENRHLNYHLGLRAECERRCGATEGTKVYDQLNRTFEYLSLAALVGGQLLALGPGVLSPSLTRLEQLRRYKKPLALPHPLQQRAVAPMDRAGDQVLGELFTPGPLLPRELGSGREASADQIRALCSQHRLAAVVRSRQVPAKGFSFDCGGRLISLASCLNYCDVPGGNDAAVLCVAQEEGSTTLQVRPKVITAQVARLYTVLGKQGRSSPSSPPRWPAQLRAATPGRGPGPRLAHGDPEGGPCADAAALLISQDHGVSPDSSVSLMLYPAYGPARTPPGRPAARDAPSHAAFPTAELPLGLGELAAGDSSEMQATFTLEPAGSRLAGGRGGGGPGVSGASPTAAGGGPTPAGQQRHSATGAAGGVRTARSPSADGGRQSLGGRGPAAPTTPTGAGKSRDQQPRGASRGPSAGGATPTSAVAPKASGTPTATTPTGAGHGHPRAFRRPGADGDALDSADVEGLARLLKDAGRLTTATLPPAPGQFLQTPLASEQPLVRHLCVIWVEAGLGEREWTQALRTFEGELSDQPRTGKALGGGADEEHRWSLETFSMWLLKRGRRLRDCSQWFRAFDFDQDDMISVTDFLQGLVAAAAPRAPEPSTAGGLCSALATFRLLDLEKRQGLDVRDLEGLFADAQVPLAGADLGMPMPHVAQQATDFDFFRSVLLPRLQGSPAFRLRVFGHSAAEA